MTTLHVEVTAEDIAKGRPQSTLKCPVALALRRASSADWEVGTWTVSLKGTEPIVMPRAVREWIEDFDFDCAVEPFAFDIEVPE